MEKNTRKQKRDYINHTVQICQNSILVLYSNCNVFREKLNHIGLKN